MDARKEWAPEGERKCKPEKAPLSTKRMSVRMRGYSCTKQGGTAGVSSCPSRERCCWVRSFFNTKNASPSDETDEKKQKTRGEMLYETGQKHPLQNLLGRTGNA